MNNDHIKKGGLLKAAALKYDETKDNAPCIVGLGQGLIAENMVSAAKYNSIPIVENKGLADALNKFSIGDEIPEELYQAVAEVLVFISRLDYDKGRHKYQKLAENLKD